MRRLGVLLFPEYELLDVYGPLEVFGNRNLAKPLFDIVTAAEIAGPVASVQGSRGVADYSLTDCPHLDVLMVPGGLGTRREVDNPVLTKWIAERAAKAELMLSVCTGASLLARAGVLDGRRATTNKRSFDWVASQGPKTEWVRQARWVDDGNVVTSSGVTAGIDMALAIVARLAGRDQAEHVAWRIEHTWNSDPDVDPFV